MSGANVEPVTAEDARRLEAAMRRAINSPAFELVPGRREELLRLALIASAQAPHLLNLVGSVVIAVVLWPHPLPLLGVGCFVTSSLICMCRAAR